jgi:hypothetical protein
MINSLWSNGLTNWGTTKPLNYDVSWHKNSLPSSELALTVAIIETKWLLPLNKIIAAYPNYRRKQKHSLGNVWNIYC